MMSRLRFRPTLFLGLGVAVLLTTLTLHWAGGHSGDGGRSGKPPLEGFRLVFKAGFEAPVTLVSNEEGSRAWLKGVDSAGYAWDGLNHVFQLVAPRSLGRLVEIRFSTEQVHSGSRSLFMRQNKEQDGTQARLQFFSNDAAFGKEILTRRHYFIPSKNLTSLRYHNATTSIAGTRETRAGGADFSMPLDLTRLGRVLVFGQAVVDYSAGPNWSDWTRPPKGLQTYGSMTPVPLDRWFQLDTYILRHPTKGQIKVWVDKELIFDLREVRTKNDTDSWFTKLADVDAEPAPFELWVDDVEIWSR